MPDPPDSTPVTAADLVRRAVPEFESMLTGYACNLTGDLEMARDVVQDTFIKLYAQDPARLDGPGTALRFLQRVLETGRPVERPAGFAETVMAGGEIP